MVSSLVRNFKAGSRRESVGPLIYNSSTSGHQPKRRELARWVRIALKWGAVLLVTWLVYRFFFTSSPPTLDVNEILEADTPVALQDKQQELQAAAEARVSANRQQELLKRQYEMAMKRMEPFMSEVPVVLSVIIPTYMQYDTLRRALDSVTSQEFPSFEVIVVNDGNPDSERFYEMAHRYAQAPPPEVSEVMVYAEGEKPKHSKAKPGVVRFVSKDNGGLADARNYGISIASGRWILTLDSDDLLAPDFMKRVVSSLFKQNKSLVKPGNINMIITDMGDIEGRPTAWQPMDIHKVDLRIENAFHCSALFLKAAWEAGVKYKPVLTFGWEDWDFWLNFHQRIGIQPMYIRKPLFLYSTWGTKPGSSMASFCSVNVGMCRAIFRLANAEYYDQEMMLAAANTLLGKGADGDGSIAAAMRHSRWHHVEKNAKAGDTTALLLTGISKQVDKEYARAIEDYMEVLNQGCDSHGRDKIAYYLLSQLKEYPPAGVSVPSIPNPTVICEQSKNCANLAQMIEDKMEAHRHETNGVDQRTFHMFLTKRPSNPQWTQLFHHSAFSVLQFHPGSVLVLHVSFDNHDSVTGIFLRSKYRDRVIITPVCSTYLAYSHGFQAIDSYLMKNAAGRPYWYSHFTDYYRFLVMYAYGGVYIDADIVLRAPITHLRNALSFEDERKGWVNGAFMSFDKGHSFLKSCLHAIPRVYDPYDWGTIGPLLLSKMTRGHPNGPTIYPRESFYSVPWWTKEDLTTKVLSDRKWKEDGENGVYGYHFWSKLLFLDNVAIVKDSAAARALTLTCHEGMACLYNDEVERAADDKAAGVGGVGVGPKAVPPPQRPPAKQKLMAGQKEQAHVMDVDDEEAME